MSKNKQNTIAVIERVKLEKCFYQVWNIISSLLFFAKLSSHLKNFPIRFDYLCFLSLLIIIW